MSGERFDEVAGHFSEVFPGLNVQDVRPGLKRVLLNLGFAGDNNWCVSEALPVDNPSLRDPPVAKRRRVETEGAPVEKASAQEVAAEPEVPVAPEAPVPVEPQVLDREVVIVRAQVHVPPDPEVTLDKGHVDNGSGDHPDNPPENSNDAGNNSDDNLSTASSFTVNKPVMQWTVGAKSKMQELGLYARFDEGAEGPIFRELRETVNIRVNSAAKATQIMRKISSVCYYVQRHCDLPVDNGFDPACLDRMEVWTQLFTLLLQGGYVSAPTALMYYDAMKKFFKWAWFSNNDHKSQCAHLLAKVEGFHKRCSSDAHGNRAARNANLLKTGEIDKTGDHLRAICKAFRDRHPVCRQKINKYKLPVVNGDALSDEIDIPRSDVNYVARHLMCTLVYLHNHRPSVPQNLTVGDVLAITEVPNEEYFSTTVGKHKTSKTHTAVILLDELEKELFVDYLFYVRPLGKQPSNSKEDYFFLNAEGKQFTSIGKEVDRHCALEGLPRVTVTEVRKMMETESARHGTLSYTAKYLCHTEKVARSEYVRPDVQDHIRARKAMESYQIGVPVDEAQASTSAAADEADEASRAVAAGGPHDDETPRATFASSYVPEEAVQKFLDEIVLPEFPLSVGSCPKDFVRDNLKEFSQANVWKAFMKGKDPARAVQDRYRIRLYESKALIAIAKFPKRPTIDQAKALISKNGWNKLKPRRVCQLWTEPRKTRSERKRPDLSQYYSERIARQDWPNLATKDFGERGLGVLATGKLLAGTIVCNYPGVLVSPEETKERLRLADINSDIETERWYVFMFERDGKSLRMMRDSTQPEYSDVTGSPALGRFINHSSLHPNVKSLVQDINGVPHILYKALRDILAGEELLYDYADKREGLPEWFKTTIHNCPCGKCEKYRRNKRIQFSPPSKSSRVCKTGVDMPLNLAPKVMSGLAIKFDRVIIENGAADFESLKNSAEAVAAEMNCLTEFQKEKLAQGLLLAHYAKKEVNDEKAAGRLLTSPSKPGLLRVAFSIAELSGRSGTVDADAIMKVLTVSGVGYHKTGGHGERSTRTKIKDILSRLTGKCIPKRNLMEELDKVTDK